MKFSFTICCLLLIQQVFAQTASVKGNVSDQVSKDGLAGAFIAISNTPHHKIADDKGNFEFRNLPAGTYELVISNVGYTPLHRNVTLREGQSLQLFIALVP